MTPTVEDFQDMCSPKSPEPESMNIGHFQALYVSGEDEDLQPVTNLVSPHEEMVNEVIRDYL